MFKEPIVVIPVAYELPINVSRWCKLGDVCNVARNIAAMLGSKFGPSPVELVSDFASLVRPNRCGSIDQERGEKREIGKQYFRYSLTGRELQAKEVVCQGFVMTDPPYAHFEFEGCDSETFVPEEWAKNVLRAVRLGARSAVRWNDKRGTGIVGFPIEDNAPLIEL
jgi:hypothetical protein